MTRTVQRWRGTLLPLAVVFFLLAGYAYAEEDMTDSQITSAVEAELLIDPAVVSDFIDVSTDAGVVTLEGNVNNLLAERRAEDIATTVRGVRSVINRIEVNPPEVEDDSLRMYVQQALLWDPATEKLEIAVSARQGQVRLEGTVESHQEKLLADIVTAGVRGVEELRNDITVDYTEERSDGEIREEIRRSLHWNAYIDDYIIDVHVDDGNVALEGTVGSMAEKNEATLSAWVAGVEQVNNLNLEVDPAYSDPDQRSERYADLSDDAIEQAVFDTYFYDPRVNAMNVDVEADDGHVTLSGTVDNLKARRVAARDARNVLGVWGVDNRVLVRPELTEDQEIRENIRTAFLRDPYVERFDISVVVDDGQVYLDGKVDSYYEKARADDIAARQSGVREVVNFLEISETQVAVFEPYMDQWYINDFNWFHRSLDTVSGMTDWEIRWNIQEQILWSPHLDSEDIQVEVDNGMARLTGTVSTWHQRNEATMNALEGGANLVDNDIKVTYGPEFLLLNTP